MTTAVAVLGTAKITVMSLKVRAVWSLARVNVIVPWNGKLPSVSRG